MKMSQRSKATVSRNYSWQQQRRMMSAYSKYWPITTAVVFALFAMELDAQQQTAIQDEGYTSPSAAVATGKASGMKFRLLSENGGMKQYAIVLAKGDEVMSGL